MSALENCHFCEKVMRSTDTVITAECKKHKMCTTCAAIFLKGLSATPACPKCYAETTIAKYLGKTSNQNRGSAATRSPTNCANLVDLETDEESFEVEDEIRTFTNYSRTSKSRKTNENVMSVQYNDDVPSNTATIPVTNKANCYYRLDPNSGKTVKYFPYQPLKLKESQEQNTDGQFKEVKIGGQQPTKEKICEPSSLIATNYNHCFGSDIAYVDNLFAFLRDEKSKFQSMTLPSVKSKYETYEEKEFKVSDHVKYNRSIFNSEKANNTGIGGKTKHGKKPRLMANLIKQISNGGNDEVNSPENRSDTPVGNGKQGSHSNLYHYDTLTVRPSVSPASDVRGEYGSEDDKHSLSSFSGSGLLGELQQQSDASEIHRQNSTLRDDGARCPLPVYEKAFDDSLDSLQRPCQNNDYSVYNAKYSGEIEEERCTSPCKANRRSCAQTSSAWLINNNTSDSSQQRLVLSHHSNELHVQNSSSEEEIEDDDIHQSSYEAESTEAELIYLDDEDVDDHVWH